MSASGTDNTASRDKLGFVKAVNLYIEPLLVSSGFVRTAATNCLVAYRSPDVVLTVVHDRLSYDVGIEFSRLDDPDLRGTLGGLLAMKGESLGFQASTPERLESVLKRMAGLLEEHGGPVLAGDDEVFRALVADTKIRSEVYTRSVVQKPVRQAADDAWRKREFARVVDLYESIEVDLTAVELSRLQYARSHLS